MSLTSFFFLFNKNRGTYIGRSISRLISLVLVMVKCSKLNSVEKNLNSGFILFLQSRRYYA